MKKFLVLGVMCFAASLEAGQVVFDKEEGGEPVKESVFTVDGVEYETDSEGKIVIPTPSAKTDTPAKPEFVNPLAKGVSYDTFLAAIPKGKTVASYLKGKLTQDEIDWIERELAFHEQNKNPQPEVED